MNPFFRLARLVRLIIAKGKFRQSGPDFQNVRRQSLDGLSEFYPTRGEMISPRRSLRNPFLHNLFGQAAYIKNAFKRQGGHLSVPALNICYIRNPKAASTALVYAMLSARYPRLKNIAL